MARYIGKIGFITEEETTPGVFTQVPVERIYRGDSYEAGTKWVDSGRVNDNISLTTQVSIVTDEYARSNFRYVKYAEFMGSLWEVTNIKYQRPRIVLSLGGPYTGLIPINDEDGGDTDGEQTESAEEI